MSRAAAGGPRASVARVGEAVRRMGALSVLMSQAVAARVGLTMSDLECLDLVGLRDSVTAGDLARASGLSTGATTALIDRLERAGYVRREADPDDRRRVLIRLEREATAPIAALYEPIAHRSGEVWERFTDDELAIVERFLTETLEIGVTSVAELQAEPVQRRPGRRR